jgi:hypothetical protein
MAIGEDQAVTLIVWAGDPAIGMAIVGLWAPGGGFVFHSAISCSAGWPSIIRETLPTFDFLA